MPSPQPGSCQTCGRGSQGELGAGRRGQALDPQNFCWDSFTTKECNFARPRQNLVVIVSSNGNIRKYRESSESKMLVEYRTTKR